MRVSLASLLFACTLMASAGTARAGTDGGDDGGAGGGATGTSGSGGAGGVPIGIQMTSTPDNLGCSTAGQARGERSPEPVAALGLAMVGAALARRRRPAGGLRRREGVR